jgi:hypothetical protein
MSNKRIKINLVVGVWCCSCYSCIHINFCCVRTITLLLFLFSRRPAVLICSGFSGENNLQYPIFESKLVTKRLLVSLKLLYDEKSMYHFSLIQTSEDYVFQIVLLFYTINTATIYFVVWVVYSFISYL